MLHSLAFGKMQDVEQRSGTFSLQTVWRNVALYVLFNSKIVLTNAHNQKPLTMYFLRRAHELSISRPDRLLSSSFWMSEGKQASDFKGFDAVMSGIEHPLGECLLTTVDSSFLNAAYVLGRLLYTTGDIPGAVRCFLSLLRWSSASTSPLAQLSNRTVDNTKDPSNSDKVFLEDFQVAISVMHLFPPPCSN